MFRKDPIYGSGWGNKNKHRRYHAHNYFSHIRYMMDEQLLDNDNDDDGNQIIINDKRIRNDYYDSPIYFWDPVHEFNNIRSWKRTKKNKQWM